MVRDIDDATLLGLAISENLEREDLSAIEEGRGFAKMLELSPQMTQVDLAHRFGKSQPFISNAIRLLALPDEVQKMIEAGQLHRAHGTALVPIATLTEACCNIARKAVTDGLTQGQVADKVKEIQDKQALANQPKLPGVSTPGSTSPSTNLPGPVTTTEKITHTSTEKTENLTTATTPAPTPTTPVVKEDNGLGESDLVDEVDEETGEITPAASAPITAPAPPVAAPTPAPAPTPAAAPVAAKAPSGDKTTAVILVTLEDWMWEQGIESAQQAIEMLQANFPYLLTPLARKCAKALNTTFNDQIEVTAPDDERDQPEKPATISETIEFVLKSHAIREGFETATLDTLPE